MAHWRSGLTHIPLKDTFNSSNLLWVIFLLQEKRVKNIFIYIIQIAKLLRGLQ